jgi:tRNA(Ile)-lysidine synthase TilS/MesJ
MIRCTRCVLPQTFPGVDIDETGLCRFCRTAPKAEKGKASLIAKFETLLTEIPDDVPYHAIVAYSGGKDSSYTLYVLRHTYHLRLLAFTMDNGFVAPTAWDNMENVVKALDIDQVIYRPRFPLLCTLFAEGAKRALFPPKTLQRASTICTTCMGFVKFAVLRRAIEERIPLVVYGWSPGQLPLSAALFRLNGPLLRSMQAALKEPLRRVVGPEIDSYFLRERHFEDERWFPTTVSPLAFLEYDEEKIIETVSELGWQRPTEPDANSTNCLLNSFANRVHRAQFGFHPYAWELAGLVRQGHLTRDEAIVRLEDPEDPEVVRQVEERLGMRGET